MPGPYTRGAQNADKAFEVLNAGKIVVGVTTATTTDAAVSLAHGLGAAPDFVIAMDSSVVAAAHANLSWAANATTITFTRGDTTNAGTVSYILGIFT